MRRTLEKGGARVRLADDRPKGYHPHLGTVYEVSDLARRTQDLEGLAAMALELTLRALNLNAGAIRYVDEATGEVVLLAHQGVPGPVARHARASPRLKMGQGLAGITAQSGEPLIVEDLSHDTRVAHFEAVRRAGFQSSVTLPLKVNGKVVGTITGFSWRRRAFPPSDLELMCSLGNMIGLAIANARLFALVEAKGKEWEHTFDAISDAGVTILGPDFRIRRANQGMGRMLSTTPQALVGRPCYEVVHGTKEPIAGCPVARCIAEGQAADMVWCEPNLGQRWLHGRAYPMLGPQGELLGVVYGLRDITERKEAEETLAKSLATAASVLDVIQTASKGSATVNASLACASKLKGLVPFDELSTTCVLEGGEGFEALTLERHGDAWVESRQTLPLKGSATEWVVSSAQTHVEDDVSQKRRFGADAALAQRGFKAVLRVPLSSDGLSFGSFELRSRQAGVYGEKEQQIAQQLSGVLSHIVWYQHLANLEKEARLKLEEQDKFRKRLLAFLAHELGGALTPLVASAGLLAEQFPDAPGSFADRCVRNIMAGTQDLQAMISDLMDVAHYQEGTLPLEIEVLDPRAVIKDVLSLFEPMAQGKGQSLTAALTEGLPCVRADRQRMRQVLTNLLHNATKFTPQGGSIEVRAAVQGDELRVEVTDSGPGLSTSDQKKLFEPRWRSRSRRQGPQGLGLGLAMCKQLVEAHGGSIGVECEPGQGSTFSFSIPLRRHRPSAEGHRLKTKA